MFISNTLRRRRSHRLQAQHIPLLSPDDPPCVIPEKPSAPLWKSFRRLLCGWRRRPSKPDIELHEKDSKPDIELHEKDSNPQKESLVGLVGYMDSIGRDVWNLLIRGSHNSKVVERLKTQPQWVLDAIFRSDRLRVVCGKERMDFLQLQVGYTPLCEIAS